MLEPVKYIKYCTKISLKLSQNIKRKCGHTPYTDVDMETFPLGNLINRILQAHSIAGLSVSENISY